MHKKLYAIFAQDYPNSLEARKEARSEHLKRLELLQAAGNLVLAGPCPATDELNTPSSSFTGSLIVARFNSLTEAESWASSDPYIKAGVYEKVTIKPFIQVLPKLPE